jgi:hypothetical protein
MVTPADTIAAAAQECYDLCAPTLRVHNLCQIGAVLLLGICAARGIPARLCFSPNHPEFSGGAHFWVDLLGENVVIDLPTDRRFRVRAARRQPATAT